VYQQKEVQAKELGFESLDVAEEAKSFLEEVKKSGMSIEDAKAMLKSKQSDPEFPEKDVTNPGRRKAKLLGRLSEVEEKKYEERPRQVRISAGSIDKEPYLRRLYINEDGEMLCQICQYEMPFKKRNGEYFFEAVEAFNKDYFSKEHEAQYLALCPVCAAKYKEFVKRDEENMEEFWERLYHSESKTIPLQLGEEETEVRFVGVHFQDMKVILAQ
jgi:DNA-binding transcriptional MerR regulator